VTPTIGRTVIYREGDFELSSQSFDHSFRGMDGTNGTREHPAIITRVWSDTCVNLTVFLDAVGPQVRNSVVLLPKMPKGVALDPANSGWRWPDRPSPIGGQ
jgi:hypothetical protein